jgi:hypothetical protein
MDLGKESSHTFTTHSISKKSSMEGGEEGGDNKKTTAIEFFFSKTPFLLKYCICCFVS